MTEHALLGKQLGAYTVESLAGQGGMASVYRAYHPATSRYVAIKVLLPNIAVDSDFRKRFEREAKVLAGLQHVHILPVFDYGDYNGQSYLVMPYLPGKTLADKIRVGLPLNDAVRLFRQIANALDYAHQQGVLHRDIKPSNVMLDDSGNALLADFGLTKLLDEADISKLTATSTIVGTPLYMSPEQGQGITLTPQSDLYSLGVMLYEMLSAQVPFRAETPVAVVFKHVTEAPPDIRTLQPDLPVALTEILDRALAKSPQERYPTASALADALEAAISGQPMPVITPVAPRNDGEMTSTQVQALTAAQAQYELGRTTIGHEKPKHDATISVDLVKEKGKNAANRPLQALIGGGVGLLVSLGAALIFFRVSQSTSGIAGNNVVDTSAYAQLAWQAQAHDEPITALDFGAGDQLLSGGEDNTAYLWNVGEAEPAEKIEGFSADISSVDIDPDSQTYLITDGATAGLKWLRADGEILTTDLAPIDVVLFIPTKRQQVQLGGIVLTLGALVDPANYEQESGRYMTEGRTIPNPTNVRFTAVAVDSSGTYLASGDESGRVQVWGTDNNGVKLVFPFTDDPVNVTAFSPDGQYLAAGSTGDTVHIWPMASLLERNFTAYRVLVTLGGASPIHDLAFSPAGDTLAVAAGSVVEIWNIEQNSRIQTLAFPEDVLTTVAFSDNGWLVAGAASGTLYGWRVPTPDVSLGE
jgi:serine/threonine protein kinase/WD40 repeat protein